jgi:uncharacterized protein
MNMNEPPGGAPDITNLPIFPLGTVLFPGGVLPLRVFEARYVDMTRECMKAGTPFGVCLIKSGAEVGVPAVPHETGCLATITDWDMTEPGILQIRTQGMQRFQLAQTRTEKNGLIRAQVTLLPPDEAVPVRAAFSSCALLLSALMPKLPAGAIAEPHRFEESGWLANRIAELLPIQPLAKQKLMELQDPDARLEIIHKFLEQQGLKQQ